MTNLVVIYIYLCLAIGTSLLCIYQSLPEFDYEPLSAIIASSLLCGILWPIYLVELFFKER